MFVKLLNMKLIMSNFSTKIFLWTILHVRLNENVWSFYIHQKECVRLTVTVSVLWLPNQFSKHFRFLGGDIQYFWDGGRALYGGGGLGILWGGTWSPLRNHAILSYTYKFMSGYLYFPNILKDIEDHI